MKKKKKKKKFWIGVKEGKKGSNKKNSSRVNLL